MNAAHVKTIATALRMGLWPRDIPVPGIPAAEAQAVTKEATWTP